MKLTASYQKIVNFRLGGEVHRISQLLQIAEFFFFFFLFDSLLNVNGLTLII